MDYKSLQWGCFKASSFHSKVMSTKLFAVPMACCMSYYPAQETEGFKSDSRKFDLCSGYLRTHTHRAAKNSFDGGVKCFVLGSV